MPIPKDTCDICHLPFNQARRNTVSQLGIVDRWYLMCSDCHNSLKHWMRTREEVGREEREKRKDNG